MTEDIHSRKHDCFEIDFFFQVYYFMISILTVVSGIKLINKMKKEYHGLIIVVLVTLELWNI